MTDFNINPNDELPDDASIFVPDNDPTMPGYDPDREPTYIDPSDPYGGGTPFLPDSDNDGTPDVLDTDDPNLNPDGDDRTGGLLEDADGDGTPDILQGTDVWDTESGDKPWLTDPDWTPEGGDETPGLPDLFDVTDFADSGSSDQESAE